jgi:hypothetical protein
LGVNDGKWMEVHFLHFNARKESDSYEGKRTRAGKYLRPETIDSPD